MSKRHPLKRRRKHTTFRTYSDYSIEQRRDAFSPENAPDRTPPLPESALKFMEAQRRISEECQRSRPHMIGRNVVLSLDNGSTARFAEIRVELNGVRMFSQEAEEVRQLSSDFDDMYIMFEEDTHFESPNYTDVLNRLRSSPGIRAYFLESSQDREDDHWLDATRYAIQSPRPLHNHPYNDNNWATRYGTPGPPEETAADRIERACQAHREFVPSMAAGFASMAHLASQMGPVIHRMTEIVSAIELAASSIDIHDALRDQVARHTQRLTAEERVKRLQNQTANARVFNDLREECEHVHSRTDKILDSSPETMAAFAEWVRDLYSKHVFCKILIYHKYDSFGAVLARQPVTHIIDRTTPIYSVHDNRESDWEQVEKEYDNTRTLLGSFPELRTADVSEFRHTLLEICRDLSHDYLTGRGERPLRPVSYHWSPALVEAACNSYIGSPLREDVLRYYIRHRDWSDTWPGTDGGNTDRVYPDY